MTPTADVPAVTTILGILLAVLLAAWVSTDVAASFPLPSSVTYGAGTDNGQNVILEFLA